METYSSHSSSGNPPSEVIERTEVLHNPEDMVNTTKADFSKIKKNIDVCCDEKGVAVTVAVKPIWEGYLALKGRGVKMRWITDITQDNILYCKEVMAVADVRHIDGIKGAFGIHDGIEYRASANVRDGGQLPPELILSNVKEIVQQQQQIFNILWEKAIPSNQRIKEIEQGLRREFIDVIRDPVEIKKLIFSLLRSATNEILILFSTLNTFHAIEQGGVLQVIQASSKRNVNVRILLSMEKMDEKTEKMREEIKRKMKSAEKDNHVIFQIISKLSFQTKIITIIVDSTFCLTAEMKHDDATESFEKSVGLATYSNSESTVDTYTSIFETLWAQNLAI